MMRTLTKNLLASAVVVSLALTGVVIAEEGVKHRTIDINVVKDQDVKVKVASEMGTESLFFTPAELKDAELLESRLANLDPDTKETISKALKGINMSGEGGAQHTIEKVFVMNKGDGERLEFYAEDEDNVKIEFSGDGNPKMIRKHIVDGDGEYRVLKGHSDAITKLIENGEFSRDELDKIQAALDAKR
ncbi:hypothetical protein ACOI22_02730 [Glaciecola sp. 2405UD65-10]|uniref:hypothetical protein n=1 Tax=Glaciecola sp. 2405UD65-10 TaxID=3397244 RepID=UPI003B5B6840